MRFFSAIFLDENGRLLNRLGFLRRMGGGPRTFPGGLNKWQWKRMHEKKAREKEKRLLDQEKQVYQARIRSEIRAKLASAENLTSGQGNSDNQNNPDYGPLTPKEHIKALADRFMKEGAEDLWNENDGPKVIPENKPGRSLLKGQPIDMQNLTAEGSSYSNGRFANVAKPRGFCTHTGLGSNMMIEVGNGGLNLMDSCRNGFRFDRLHMKCYYSADAASFRNKTSSFVRNNSSRIDGKDAEVRSGNGKSAKWPRFRMDSSDDDSDDFEEDGGLEGGGKVLRSSAALGKYDVKIEKRRVPLKVLEDEDDLSQRIAEIRNEIRQKKAVQEEEEEEIGEEESLLSTKRFDEVGGVSSLTVQALAEAGYVQMTRVQEATLSACLEGRDAFVKARAGTGKSVAFLLPAIETVLKASNDRSNQRIPPINVLIVCPTRELASQVCAEARVLLKHHHGIGVQALVGGTRFKVDQRRLESDPCQMLVATPGRLLDHIENKSGISVRLMRLKMLILDEADHLLDLGFRKDIEKIIDCLPRSRQSLLFSATVPKEVRRISQLVLKREHAYIDTVGLGSLETSSKVKQFYVITPHDQHLQIVYHLLKSHTSEVIDYKVIVFCATATMTSLVYTLLQKMKLNVREIHSKKPQLYRTRISDEFKEAKGLILITSDVSARGMNYPDVTLVIQVGIPLDRGHYIHRLGRTGRQGKEGEGLLLLAPWEQYFLGEIKDLPLEKYPLSKPDPNSKLKIQESLEKIDISTKEAAYHAWLGYYNSIGAIGRDKTTLVELANQFSASIGLDKPPALYRRTVLKMGLKGIPGIRIHN
ncbi:probable DEAD-box ATP-dependent RNA helicase 48 [Andrographis paniculata]|uniref:probable DEAD-box ATP-dependent RNA helicase 48 n=1 Tax=Andrographis paniculata TaxID=175694 RepID=UPI0021E98201|nr:probable DEAD-box ATP-dependent RNA helicase 48 [Andrographis paniculata]XP_051151316.1 probable DEAD-box ATP-dependent RNA helicase 48 [Andrographis paniculata]XP_051151317.1 probable DEAD-box ATP-dependent RNA helicase 48 [Andrographis paniculata]